MLQEFEREREIYDYTDITRKGDAIIMKHKLEPMFSRYVIVNYNKCLNFMIFRYKPTNLHNDYQDKIVFPTYQKHKETNNRSGLMNDGKKLLI